MKNKSDSISRESLSADPLVIVADANLYIILADWPPYVVVLGAIKDDERLSDCTEACTDGFSKRDL